VLIIYNNPARINAIPPQSRASKISKEVSLK
jgi:hypothetical protein